MPLFKALIDNSNDVFSLLSVTGEILYASASSADVFGYRPEELVGRSTFDLIHPSDREQSRRVLREVVARPPKHRHLQARFQQKNGHWRWVESTISNLLDEPDVAAVVLNCRAVNSGAVASELLPQRAPPAGPHEDLEQFAHAVAHDLREPLRSLSMFVQLLLKGAHLDEDGRLFADSAVECVTRISSLFDGLQELALCGSEDAGERVDLAKAAQEALQNLQYALTESGACVTVGTLPKVTGSRTQLVRVFQNLLSNAIKYRRQARVEIDVSSHQTGPDWVIEVRDNGIGIAERYHERIFLRLKRLHSHEIPGTGLGLAICKRIVEGLGGKIWVRSAPEAGATFGFTIPLEKTARPLPAEASYVRGAAEENGYAKADPPRL